MKGVKRGEKGFDAYTVHPVLFSSPLSLSLSLYPFDAKLERDVCPTRKDVHSNNTTILAGKHPRNERVMGRTYVLRCSISCLAFVEFN